MVLVVWVKKEGDPFLVNSLGPLVCGWILFGFVYSFD